MRKEYFENAEKLENFWFLTKPLIESRYGGLLALPSSSPTGFLQSIINFVTDNKPLIGATKNIVTTAVNTGKQIKDASYKIPEDYKKSDKELIEEMKVEKVYSDLQNLKELKKLKTGLGFKII